MTLNLDDPTTWPMKIHLIAHDVGRTSDRSTAVVGGRCPFIPGGRLLGVKQFVELPLGLCDSQLANELAAFDQTYNRDCLIFADLSNDASYAETLYDTFGRRVIGVCKSVAPAMARPASSGASEMVLCQSIGLAGLSCLISYSPNCRTVWSALPKIRKVHALMSSLMHLRSSSARAV